MATPLFRTESIVSTELFVFTTVTKAKGLVRTISQDGILDITTSILLENLGCKPTQAILTAKAMGSLIPPNRLTMQMVDLTVLLLLKNAGSAQQRP
jgi:hypothetical protein